MMAGIGNSGVKGNREVALAREDYVGIERVADVLLTKAATGRAA
jgi:hypothetical protein